MFNQQAVTINGTTPSGQVFPNQTMYDSQMYVNPTAQQMYNSMYNPMGMQQQPYMYNNGYLNYQYQNNGVGNRVVVTNNLSQDEIMALRQKQSNLVLGLDQLECIAGACNHHDDHGNVACTFNQDGSYTCNICGERFYYMPYEQQNVEDTVARMLDYLQTMKMLFVDLPPEAAKSYFQIIPMLKKFPKVYELANSNFSKYEKYGLGNGSMYPQYVNPYTMINNLTHGGVMGYGINNGYLSPYSMYGNGNYYNAPVNPMGGNNFMTPPQTAYGFNGQNYYGQQQQIYTPQVQGQVGMAPYGNIAPNQMNNAFGSFGQTQPMNANAYGMQQGQPPQQYGMQQQQVGMQQQQQVGMQQQAQQQQNNTQQQQQVVNGNTQNNNQQISKGANPAINAKFTG